MPYKSYKINYLDRFGKYKPGAICEQVKPSIAKEDPTAEDRKNRSTVVEKISELVNSGLNVEDAVRFFIQDKQNTKLIEKFNYLKTLNLETVFANWYNGSKKDKKPIEISEQCSGRSMLW